MNFNSVTEITTFSSPNRARRISEERSVYGSSSGSTRQLRSYSLSRVQMSLLIGLFSSRIENNPHPRGHAGEKARARHLHADERCSIGGAVFRLAANLEKLREQHGERNRLYSMEFHHASGANGQQRNER